VRATGGDRRATLASPAEISITPVVERTYSSAKFYCQALFDLSFKKLHAKITSLFESLQEKRNMFKELRQDSQKSAGPKLKKY
jgi:hypothetical protein